MKTLRTHFSIKQMDSWLIWIRHVTSSLLKGLVSISLPLLHEFKTPTYTFTFLISLSYSPSTLLITQITPLSLSLFPSTADLYVNLIFIFLIFKI